MDAECILFEKFLVARFKTVHGFRLPKNRRQTVPYDRPVITKTVFKMICAGDRDNKFIRGTLLRNRKHGPQIDPVNTEALKTVSTFVNRVYCVELTTTSSNRLLHRKCAVWIFIHETQKFRNE